MFTKSSFCNCNGCVEVGSMAGSILVRDTKSPNSSPQVYSVSEWQQFLDGVKNGEFEIDRLIPDHPSRV